VKKQTCPYCKAEQMSFEKHGEVAHYGFACGGYMTSGGAANWMGGDSEDWHCPQFRKLFNAPIQANAAVKHG
jgi:hypothetical protein